MTVLRGWSVNRILITSFGIFLFLAGTGAFAQAPPPPPAPGTPSGFSADHGTPERDVHVRKGFVSMFYGLQARGTFFIKKEIGILRSGFDLKTFVVISLFSLLYGILHTLGPGHGKLIVVSFFMRDGTTTSDAFALSVIISLIHASGAILLAVLFQTLLSSVKGVEQLRIQYGFTLFSGLLVLCIGIIYLIRTVGGKDHRYKKVDAEKVERLKGLGRWKRNLFIGFSIGVVPCPLSLTIMMVSIIYGVFWIGITSVIFLTLAMVVILYYLSISTIKSREYVEYKSGSKQKRGRPFLSVPVFAYLGNISLIALGIYFTYKGVVALI